MSNQELEFRIALGRFIRSIEMSPISINLWKGQNPSHVLVSWLTTTYRLHETGEHHQLIAPKAEFELFVQTIGELFTGQVNQQLILNALANLLSDKIEYPFPDKTVEEYYQEIWKRIIYYIDTTVEALVPLRNFISYIDIDEVFLLANAVFCSGYAGSLLTRKAAMLTGEKQDYNRTSFLKLQVGGDKEHRKQQLDGEVENALRVLRFVTMWEIKTVGSEKVHYNPAAFVGEYEKGYRYAIFHRPEQEDNVEGEIEFYGEWFYFHPQNLQYAREIYGLDDINYHYTRPDNPISNRILRALEMYDSGTLALNRGQAIYRYAASIDVVLPVRGRKVDIASTLNILVKYGNFIGFMEPEKVEKLPENERWEKMVWDTTQKYINSYNTRNLMLHGPKLEEKIDANQMKSFSDKEVQTIRQLAHNAIRLMAFFARDFNWETNEDAKKWFENPCDPPSRSQNPV